MGGHSTSDDPNAYRGSDALKPWADRDPIERVRQYLGARGAWDAETERVIVADLEGKFREAVEIAERTAKPRLESMFDDVYAKPPWHLVEERAELVSGPRPPEHG
jgi:2-oxoisovalerate dehydrogenase E1 component alpha subunit